MAQKFKMGAVCTVTNEYFSKKGEKLLSVGEKVEIKAYPNCPRKVNIQKDNGQRLTIPKKNLE